MNKAINLSFYECRSPDEFRAKHNEICQKNGWTALDTVQFEGLTLGIYAEQVVQPELNIVPIECGYLVNNRYLVTHNFIEAWKTNDPCCPIDCAYLQKHSPFDDVSFAEIERIMRSIMFEREMIHDVDIE